MDGYSTSISQNSMQPLQLRAISKWFGGIFKRYIAELQRQDTGKFIE